MLNKVGGQLSKMNLLTAPRKALSDGLINRVTKHNKTKHNIRPYIGKYERIVLSAFSAIHLDMSSNILYNTYNI